MLTKREQAAVDCCKANLYKVEPHPDYVGGGKFAVPPADNPSRGKCYLASAALCDFFGGPKAGYHLVKASNHLGDHYWVITNQGVVIDATKEQFDLIGEKPPYRLGRKVGKRNTLKKHLPLLDALRELEDAEPEAVGTSDLFGRPTLVDKAAVLSDAQEAKLTNAWTALIADWGADPEAFIRCTYPKGALAVQFVRALLYGEEIPRYATMAYTWDRYYVAGSAYPFNEMLPRALEDPRVVRGIRFQQGNDMTFNKLISGSLPILGYRLPLDFPISLAKRLIDRYCPQGGRVLDPCHGWGGRLVGFLLSGASVYVGVDPAPHSYKLQEMFYDLNVYLDDPKQIKLINKPFEDVALRESSYDFALTSPPYWNTEKYQGEESSWRRYKKLDEWIDGFYRALIVNVADALKPGAYFALQVTPKFDMVEAAKRIGAEVGLIYQKVFDTTMKRYNSATADTAGSTELFEVVAIFRKQREGPA